MEFGVWGYGLRVWGLLSVLRPFNFLGKFAVLLAQLHLIFIWGRGGFGFRFNLQILINFLSPTKLETQPYYEDPFKTCRYRSPLILTGSLRQSRGRLGSELLHREGGGLLGVPLKGSCKGVSQSSTRGLESIACSIRGLALRVSGVGLD